MKTPDYDMKVAEFEKKVAEFEKKVAEFKKKHLKKVRGHIGNLLFKLGSLLVVIWSLHGTSNQSLYLIHRGRLYSRLQQKGSTVRQEGPEEGWRAHQLKYWEYNNKDEDNSLNNLDNTKPHPVFELMSPIPFSITITMNDTKPHRCSHELSALRIFFLISSDLFLCILC